MRVSKLFCPLTTSLNLFSAKNDKSFGSGRRLLSAPTLSFLFLSSKKSVKQVEDGPVFLPFSPTLRTKSFVTFRVKESGRGYLGLTPIR